MQDSFNDYKYIREKFRKDVGSTTCGKCRYSVGRIFPTDYDLYCTKLNISLIDTSNISNYKKHDYINLVDCEGFDPKEETKNE